MENSTTRKLNLSEKIDLLDCMSSNKPFGITKTKVTFKNHDTGEVIWTRSNKVLQPGGGYIARKLFNFTNTKYPIKTPSYGDSLALELDNNSSSGTAGEEKVCLWCVGIDGCGRENSQVFEVDYRRWIYPENLIPFQYIPTSKEVALMTATQRKIYYGRKTVPGYFAYYFKTFDDTPTLTEQWADVTPISNSMYEDAKKNTTPVETFVTINLSITTTDCRDWFINSGSTTLNDARINCIQLCTAWPKKMKDKESSLQYDYYQDIRPITRLNFPNEPLIDLRKSIDIVYQIYF